MKVWVLEKLTPADKLKKKLFDTLELEEMYLHSEEYMKLNADEQSEQRAKLSSMIDSIELQIEDGEVVYEGIVGKKYYKQFCNEAKDAISRAIESDPSIAGNLRSYFHVVIGEVPDDSSTWVGYKIIERKQGVEKYLFATLNERE